MWGNNLVQLLLLLFVVILFAMSSAAFKFWLGTCLLTYMPAHLRLSQCGWHVFMSTHVRCDSLLQQGGPR
jgi:hypothetical protein